MGPAWRRRALALLVATACMAVGVAYGSARGGTAVFAPADDFAVGDQPEALTAGDFDGNDAPDLAVANKGDDDVSILLGDGAGNFDLDDDYTVGDEPQDIVTGKFNADPDLDLAVANRMDDDVSVLLG